MSSYNWPPQGSGSASGVSSLNSLTGALTLVAGTGISITPSGSNITIANTGAGAGTVTSVSVVSANGLAGTVATATSTPAITLSTTITGILQGNGTAISAATTGNLTDAGTDGIVVTGGTGAVLGSGTSLAQHVADTTHNGYLSSTDWNTFNGKQASGNYITALTGDGTASGPGSVALTLATVNANVGSFTHSSITVNAKGLITAASNGTAPVTTLSAVGASPNANAATITGNTLNLQPFSATQPGVVTASAGGTTNFLRADGTWAAPSGGSGTVTSVAMTVPTFLSVSGSPVTTTGTLAVTLSGTALPVANGGTSLTTLTTGNVILGAGASAPTFVAPGTSGNVLTSNGTTWISSAAPGIASSFFASTQVTTDSSAVVSGTFTTFSNSPAFTFTPTVTGTYKIYCSAPILGQAAGGGLANSQIRIFNTTGSATLLNESQADLTVPTLSILTTNEFVESVYTLTSGVSYVFDIQGKTSNSVTLVGSTGAPFYIFGELSVTASPAISFGTFGSTPNSSGAVISGAGVITLEPASASQPGGVSTTTQTLAGAKTFSSNVTLQGTGNAVGTITSGLWNGTCNAGNNFLTAGTTYTTPSNITTATQFKFTLIGGGAAGGGNPATVSTHGAGGGAGGTAIVYVTGLTASTGYTYAIGANGTGNSNAAGGNGGNTTLTIGGTTYTASGGTGGASGVAGAGGAGGTTTNATISITGQQGGDSPNTQASVTSGVGGNSMYGFGGSSLVAPASANTTGRAATGFGGGGSGSQAGTGSATVGTGGAGSPGAIIVEWWN